MLLVEIFAERIIRLIIQVKVHALYREAKNSRSGNKFENVLKSVVCAST